MIDIPEIVDGLGLGLLAGHVHRLDESGNVSSHIIVAQQLGQAGGGLDGTLGNLQELTVSCCKFTRILETYLGLEVVHSALDNGDQALELSSHDVLEENLSLVTLGGNSLLGHLSDKRESTNLTLPLGAGGLEVVLDSSQEAGNQGRQLQVAEHGVDSVLGALAHNSTLIRKAIENVANSLDQQYFGNGGLQGKGLVQGTVHNHGALAVGSGLLIASSFGHLGEELGEDVVCGGGICHDSATESDGGIERLL